jgi:hypothetical protein
MSKAPAGKAGATPRKPSPARARAPARGKPGGAGPRFGTGMARAASWRARLLGGGPSWVGVAVIVLAVLIILPIAAAVLGDIWAVIIGALIGGFALGRATAR